MTRPDYSSYDEEVEFIMEQFAGQYRQNRSVFERKSSVQRTSLLDVGRNISLVSAVWQSEGSPFDEGDCEEEDGPDDGGAAEVLQLTFLLQDVVAYANTLIIYKPNGFTLPPTCFCDADSGPAFAEMCMSANKQALQRKWSLIQLVGSVCSRLRKRRDVQNMFTLTSSAALYRVVRQRLLAKRLEELLGDDVLLSALWFSATHKRRHGVCNPRPSFFESEDHYGFEELGDSIQQLPSLQILCESADASCALEHIKLLQWFLCLRVELTLQSRLQSALVFRIKESNVRHFSRPVVAFHGTSLENVWSILQNGLQHTVVKKNGEAFGKGIYFSTKVNVAKAFARSTAKHGSRFLRYNSMVPSFLGREKDPTSLECYCVLECQVDITSEVNVKLDGSYIIVKNPKVVKLVRLHLGFEAKRKSFPSRVARVWTWVGFIACTVAIAIAILYNVDSTTFVSP